MKLDLSRRDAYNLGLAICLLQHNDVDAAVHQILPCTDAITGEILNTFFVPLFEHVDTDNHEEFYNELIKIAERYNLR